VTAKCFIISKKTDVWYLHLVLFSYLIDKADIFVVIFEDSSFQFKQVCNLVE